MPSATARGAIVFGGAPLVATPRLVTRLGGLPAPFVVAADAGAATALALGFAPDVVVGDFDSLPPATLAELTARGIPIEAYPTAKDATDGQLAIERALREQPSQLLLAGFLGGPRLDQELANVLLLLDLSVPAVLLDAANECQLLRGGQALDWSAEEGELVSLLPLQGDADGVCTSGLRWALTDERLVLGQTRGLSNEPVAAQVRVSLRHGLLLVTRHFPQ
jgi:thiamine pyrophosphokinase